MQSTALLTPDPVLELDTDVFFGYSYFTMHCNMISNRFFFSKKYVSLNKVFCEPYYILERFYSNRYNF